MGDSGRRINSDNMDMVRGKDAKEFCPRVIFKDTVCRLSCILQKHLKQNVLWGQKNRLDLVTGERIHGCQRKQNCRGQKVDKAVVVVVGTVQWNTIQNILVK